jgi:hypothetical protein
MDEASPKIDVHTLFWASLLLTDKYDKFWHALFLKTELKKLHKPNDFFFITLNPK